MDKNKTLFETKIKPVFKYVGFIGAVLSSIIYIIAVIISIYGLEITVGSSKEFIILSVVNAVIGLMILEFLKIQGISFASDLEDNKILLKQYYNTKTKDKKTHSLKYFWATSLIKDIASKGITIAVAFFGVLYISIKGSQEPMILLLSLMSLIMFISFGLLGLVKAYDYYNHTYIPYIKQRLEEKNDWKRKIKIKFRGSSFKK